MISGARKDRMWIVGGIVLALVLAAISWFFLISPKLDDAASVQGQTDAAASQNAILQAKVAKLRTDSAGMADLLRSLDTLHTQLPTTANLDDLTRQLTTQAGKAQVTVSSIVIGVPTVVKAPASAAPAATTPAGAASSDAAGGSAAGDSAATTTASAAPTTPAAAAAAPAANLYAIPVTMSADGTLANEQKLLAAIQTQGPRGALVSAVQYSPAPEDAQQVGGEPTTGERNPGAGESVPGTSVPGTGTTTTGTATTGNATGQTRQTGTAGATPTAPAAGPSAAMSTRTTMTVQFTVFVAPQTPEDEAALRKQLGG